MRDHENVYLVVKEAAWSVIKALAGVSAASTFVRVFWAISDAPARWATIVIRSLRK